jgi:predicted peptidase
MANQAYNLTGQATITGNLPFLFYESKNQSKPQPLVICLHGAGEGTLFGQPHDATTVLILDSRPGTMGLTKSAQLPTTVHPYDPSQTFDFFQIAPQQAYPSGKNHSFGNPWPQTYIDTCIDWATANRNIDTSRIYLVGHSLGGGGTIDMILRPAVRKRLAAAIASAPGYGNTASLDHEGFGQTGFPLWIVHNYTDEVLVAPNPPAVQIVHQVNDLVIPKRSVKFFLYSSGTHNNTPSKIFNLTDGASYPGQNGYPCVNNFNMFRWLCQYTNLTHT